MVMLTVEDVVDIPSVWNLSQGVAVLEGFRLKPDIIDTTPNSDTSMLTPVNLTAFILDTYWEQVQTVERKSLSTPLIDMTDDLLEDFMFVRKIKSIEEEISQKARTVATQMYWEICGFKIEESSKEVVTLQNKRKAPEELSEEEDSQCSDLRSQLLGSLSRELSLTRENGQLRERITQLEKSLVSQEQLKYLGLMVKARSTLEGLLDGLISEHFLMRNARTLPKHCCDWLERLKEVRKANADYGTKVCINDFVCAHTLDCEIYGPPLLKDRLKTRLKVDKLDILVSMNELSSCIEKLYSSMCEIHLTGYETESTLIVPHTREFRYSKESQSAFYQLLKEFFKRENIKFDES